MVLETVSTLEYPIKSLDTQMINIFYYYYTFRTQQLLKKDNKLLFYIYYYIIFTITLIQSMEITVFVCNDWRYFYFSFNWAQLDSKEASRSAQWGCLSHCCRFPFTFIIHYRTQCVWDSYLWLAYDFPNSICDPKNDIYNCLKLKCKQSNVQIGESTKEGEELNIVYIPF